MAAERASDSLAQPGDRGWGVERGTEGVAVCPDIRLFRRREVAAFVTLGSPRPRSGPRLQEARRPLNPDLAQARPPGLSHAAAVFASPGPGAAGRGARVMA